MPRTNMRDSIKSEMLQEGTRAKIIARNTFRYIARDGATITRLHQTDVVRAQAGGRYQLNSGGWRTPTTKDRINSALTGYHVYALKGSWYVVATGGPAWSGGIPYYDGMILPDAFNKKGALAKGAAAEKSEQKLRKAIRDFVKKVDTIESLAPSQGDCWLCCMRTAEGKTMGELGSNNAEHLREHIKEGYMHGSLVVNAMRWAGYQDLGIQYWLSKPPGDRSLIKRALRRYLYRQLGLAA